MASDSTIPQNRSPDRSRAAELRLASLPFNATIREAIQSLNLSSKGIVLVMDHDQRLLGTITDGDIRRGLLNQLGLDSSLERILAGKQGTENAVPITATVGTHPEHILQQMRERRVSQIPLLDGEGRVRDLLTLQDLGVNLETPAVRAVIMAGGLGMRLLPLTSDTPKPMLPIGDRPLLERIIGHLVELGIHEIHLATHHLSEKITAHFENCTDLNVSIDFLQEPFPLGTAGSLRLLRRPKETLLVMNGDILTKLDYRSMLAFHHKQHADLTVAVRLYDFKVPYGVVDVEGERVRGLVEKPTYKFAVNAGVYCLQPSVCDLIPEDSRFDMTELVQVLLSRKCTVVSFPVHEYWIDIGQPDDYARAQRDFAEGKFSITS